MAAFRTLATLLSWKGAHLAPVRSLLLHSRAPLPGPHRPLSGPVQHSAAPKQQTKPTEEEEEEEEEGPEYIPKRKAKNPMMKIGYAWMIGLPAGIITFILAKRQVDKNRLKQLKVRQRMRQSNDGEFEGSRYQRHTGS